MKNIKYYRVDHNIAEKDLLDPFKLATIENEIYILNGQLNLLQVLNKDFNLNEYNIIRSHLNIEESITTSQIEGSNITLETLGMPTTSDVRKSEEQEIINMKNVLNTFKYKIEEMPMSERLLKELHRELFIGLSKTSVKGKVGEFKTVSNSIKTNRGRTVYIPCEINEMHDELKIFEEL